MHDGLSMHQTKHCEQGWIQGGDRPNRPPPKTYESNFVDYDFIQFGKEHSRYKAILSSIVLSQPCCKVYYCTSLLQKWSRNETWLYQISLKLTPLTLLAAFAPDCETTFLALPRIAYIIFNRLAVSKPALGQKSQQTPYYYRISTKLAKAYQYLLL